MCCIIKKMDRQINSIFAISFILVVSIVVGAVVWHYGNEGIASAQILKITLQKKAEKQISQLDLEDWQNYKNDNYKFSLVLPNDWKGYKATERTFDWGTIGKSESLDFGFPKQEAFFNIAFVQRKQFKQLQSSGEPFGTYLGENSNVVFVLNQSKISNDANTAKFISEVPAIIKTFKLDK
jgi:hypothetical protein